MSQNIMGSKNIVIIFTTILFLVFRLHFSYDCRSARDMEMGGRGKEWETIFHWF